MTKVPKWLEMAKYVITDTKDNFRKSYTYFAKINIKNNIYFDH